MRVTVTLAASLLLISFVGGIVPTVAATSVGTIEATILSVACPEGECDICNPPSSPGSVPDKVRECLQG